MTILALRTCRHINAVSRLHGRVSRALFLQAQLQRSAQGPGGSCAPLHDKHPARVQHPPHAGRRHQPSLPTGAPAVVPDLPPLRESS